MLSGQSSLQGLEPYSYLMNFPPTTSNFEETPTVAIEHARAAEAAIDGANETIDSITNTAVVLIADWFLGGEMAVEQ
jgi:hypothetical protein